MIKFVEIFIDSAIMWIAVCICGNKIFERCKIKRLKIIIYIAIFSLLLAIINFLSNEIISGIIKVLIVYMLQCSFLKFLFNTKISKCVIMALIWYLCLCISEVITVLTLSAITSILGIPIHFLKNTILINLLISMLNCIIISKFHQRFKMVVNNDILISKGIVFFIIAILVTIALIEFKIPVTQMKFNLEFVVTMLMLLGFSVMTIFMVKQNSDIEQTTSMYQRVVEYSNTTNKVLEDYRMISHEHNNQLSIIRQMVNKDNIELIEYLDNLMKKRNDIKYKWVSELNKLPLEGLKGLINYKLIEAEENGINISVIISKDVSKVKLNKLSTTEKDHLYSIVGVYLDNAIQAAAKSKLKEISIEIYKENRELVFILGNTFSGKIELDKLDDYGYSTKGKNHGVGLHLVKTIIDEDELFSQSRKNIDNYFIQELRINISELNKKKK